MNGKLDRRDLLFVFETLGLTRVDLEQIASSHHIDDSELEAMLDDKRLFRRIMIEEDIFLQISPWLFFTILLRRVWRDLERKSFTVERRDRQKVILFDSDRVVRLLAQKPIRDYLVTMLASFTRIESKTVLIEVKRGIFRGYRASEFDIESMIRYSQTLSEAFRYAPYKRIADVCLFITGTFPEHINSQYPYPVGSQVRPRMRGKHLQKVEDYEDYGRTFYQMAAEHEGARREGLDAVLISLSENFILAEKPLNYLSAYYLQFSRQRLFGL